MANTRNPGEEIPKHVSRRDFPPDFVFGVATSAFQVEGGRKEGGRGDSIWDVFSHTPGNIMDGSNGDIAVDQYHCYKEDVELISKLGFNAYRFSVSWPRIFPGGFYFEMDSSPSLILASKSLKNSWKYMNIYGTGTKINEAGITYYNNLIDALLEKGVQPYLTLYHWDLPSYLHDSMGGWLNKEIVKYFATYAEACFAHFGDRVKHWITLNEPLQTAVNGYCFGIYAPGRSEHSSTEPYLTGHHQLLAHAAAVAVYKEKFKAKQGGEIGIVVDCEWAEPFSDNAHDKTAAARRIDFQLGWFLDPIYYGDYPTAMRERLGDRLPAFSEKEKELLRNSTDFVGLNHYSSRLIAHAPKRPEENGFYNEQELKRIEKWPGGEVIGDKAASEWLYIVPWGIRKVLNCIAERYHNPPIYVTENGMDEEDSEIPSLPEALEDMKRVGYFKGYLAAVAQSIRDGTDVRGYFAWSLLDNFEWNQGYTKRFGLVYVDYKNGLSRHPKSSAIWFSRFLKGSQGVEGKEK